MATQLPKKIGHLSLGDCRDAGVYIEMDTRTGKISGHFVDPPALIITPTRPTSSLEVRFLTANL